MTESSARSIATVPVLPIDHQGITELCGVLATNELAAFYRISAEATFAPDLAGRIAMASLAAAEMRNFESTSTYLAQRGVKVEEAMVASQSVVEKFHRSTTPSNWLESLVKAYVGDGLAADLFLEIGAILPAESQAYVQSVLADTGYSEFVVEQVKQTLAISPDAAAPLKLWGRRLLGEAITHTQYLLAQQDSLFDLLQYAESGVSGIAQFFESVEANHSRRMERLGLG